MKNIFAALLALFILQAGIASAQDDGFNELPGALPLQVAIYPTVQLVHFDSNVAGLRIDIIGVNRNMTGLDVGIINQTDEIFRGAGVGVANLCNGNSHGVSIGILNHVAGDVVGFQGVPYLTFWNAVNVVHGKCSGVQGGWFNHAQALSGIQGGVVNVSYEAKGIQLGLYNYAESFTGLQVGGINLAYEKASGLQIGLYNGAGSFHGVQIGVINQAQVLDGLQIGLVNIAAEKETLPVMVLANWQF